MNILSDFQMTRPRRRSSGQGESRLRWGGKLLLLLMAFTIGGGACTTGSPDPAAAKTIQFAGSETCRPCHERFYEKWEGSLHGTAMQDFSTDLPQFQGLSEPLQVNGKAYRVETSGKEAWVLEEDASGQSRYPILQALGGKNIYYFLTSLERGRLQVLPVAFDVREKEWFDTTASMVRHFQDRQDEALDWTDRPLTFNTSCFSCHVSQLSTNYDPVTDSYQTTWQEPGINCETCHGPGFEHVEVARAHPEQTSLEDPKIIVTGDFNQVQLNSMCAPCHAKMFPISDSFQPGEPFFDHFGLIGLEHPDFYPDGRDLGENYTYTHWLMNPCAKASQMDCLDCHTSSGRNRHAGEDADNACMPCHQEYVRDPSAHSFHPAESEASRCVSCHMPRTTFARMVRHDHTLLPPIPAATIEFGSPNACNLCHEEESPEWAQQWTTRWYGSDYQADYLERARLIAAARDQDWDLLPDMLRYIESKERDAVFSASLIRLLESAPGEEKWPALKKVLTDDPAPLVRAAAARTLQHRSDSSTRDVLLQGLEDETRLVRIQAASSLAAFPQDGLTPAQQRSVRNGFDEYVGSLQIRPDDYSMRYNLGNFYFSQARPQEALSAYMDSVRLQPSFVPARVNASLLLARQGRVEAAEEQLREALRTEPESAEVLFNLGLLSAERGAPEEAEDHLKAALAIDPEFAEASYNLGILIAEKEPQQALELTRAASEQRPAEPRYAYTYAFYQYQAGELESASRELEDLLHEHPRYLSAYPLLTQIYDQLGRRDRADRLLRQASQNEQIPPSERLQLQTMLQQRAR